MPLSLAQAASLRTDDGARLPHVYESFKQAGIILRRGQLHLTVAAPGGFKSTLATNYALWSRVRSLILSIDTDRNTVCKRVIAAWTHTDLDRSEIGYDQREAWAVNALASVPWLSYAFPTSPTDVEIGEHVLAYAETEGDYPELIVVDNLGDIAGAQEGHEEASRIMIELRNLALKTNAAVWVLHHALGGFDDGLEPIPLSGVKDKVTKPASLVLTLHQGIREGELWGWAVKNRHGKPGEKALLRVHGAMNLITDYYMEVAA